MNHLNLLKVIQYQNQIIEKLQFRCSILNNTIAVLNSQIWILQNQISRFHEISLNLQSLHHHHHHQDVLNYFFQSDAIFMKDFGCTPSFFTHLYNKCRSYFQKTSQTGRTISQSPRRTSPYSDKFQLMVTLFWLRRYLEEELIGRIFCIRQQKVSEIVNRCIHILSMIVCPTFQQLSKERMLMTRNRFQMMAKHLPLAAYVIDGTEIKIPTTSNKEHARNAYSIKKHQHSVNFLILVELNGNCVYVCLFNPLRYLIDYKDDDLNIHQMMTFFYSNLINPQIRRASLGVWMDDINNLDMIIIPINDIEMSHWVLIIIKPKIRQIRYFDSLLMKSLMKSINTT